MRLRTASTHWNVLRKYGLHGELFFFLFVEFGPCVSADTVNACASIGLHLMAEENAFRSDGDSSLELGDMKLKVAELTSFAVFTVPEQLSCGIVTANKPFSQHGRAVTC